MADDSEPQFFDWLEYYALAEELAKREDEASLRTAVSTRTPRFAGSSTGC